jgi:hypothetical protein
MDRIKSKNCGSRAWSKVILSQAKDLKTVRRYQMLPSIMRIHFCAFHFVRFEGVNVSIAIALYAWFHGTDS